MDAVKYLKEKKRMTKCNNNGSCGIFCSDCPLSYHNNEIAISCKAFELNYPEETVAIVEKWSEEHPLKTRAQVFFEKFPDAPKNDKELPEACAKDCGLADFCVELASFHDCIGCWEGPAPDKYQEWSDK